MSKNFKSMTHKLQRQALRARQRGYSNIQIAIGILVSVITLLGALSGYQFIQQAKVSNELSMLTDLKAATVSLGQSRATLATAEITTATLIGLNFFQGSLLTVDATGKVVKSQWGGAVTAAANTNQDGIVYTFDNVPASACKELATKVDTIADSVTIGTTVTKATGATTDLGKVGTACGATTVSIAYTMLR